MFLSIVGYSFAITEKYSSTNFLATVSDYVPVNGRCTGLV